MVKIHSFLYMGERSLRFHAAALIYPVHTQFERELNAMWVKQHPCNSYTPDETDARDFYSFHLFHATLKEQRSFPKKEFQCLLRSRTRVISSFVLGLLNQALFIQWPEEYVLEELGRNGVIDSGRLAREVIMSTPDFKRFESNDFEFIRHIGYNQRLSEH